MGLDALLVGAEKPRELGIALFGGDAAARRI